MGRFLWQHYRLLILLLICISIFGLLVLASISSYISVDIYNQPYRILFRQIFFVGLGWLAFVIVIHTPMMLWYHMRFLLFLGALGLMVAGLIFGDEINGAKRWLNVFGFGIHVYEISKIGFLAFFCAMLSRHRHTLNEGYQTLLKLFLILAVYMVFLFLQPDFSAALMLAAVIFVLMFFNGLSYSRLFLIAGFSSIGFAWLLFMRAYRGRRIEAFLQNAEVDPWGSSYQILQSWVAIKNGGFFGLGWGEGVQKLGFLPEAHNDFIFSVAIEEIGMIGMTVFLGLLFYLWFSLIRLCSYSFGYRSFNANFGIALILILIFSTLISIAVSLGLVPVTGVSLPFLSYGGSLTLYSFVAMAICFRVGYEQAEMKKQ